MMRILKWTVLLVFGCMRMGIAAQPIGAENSSSPLYVSLGSHCEVANFIGYHGLRTAAYPFDWMLTYNNSLISILEQDFEYFLDESYLTSHRFGVVNHYYYIDFRHDWPDFGNHWPKMDIRRILPQIQEKHRRRIERFYELADYPGKVVFIRAPADIDYSYDYSPTFNQEAKRIDHEDALRLRNLLMDKFPNLDFTLVIINYFEENVPNIIGLERVDEYKVRLSDKFEDWEIIFQKLEKGNL